MHHGTITATELAHAIIREGMKFDRSFLSQLFINTCKVRTALMEDQFVLPCDKKIRNIRGLLPALGRVAKAVQRFIQACLKKHRGKAVFDVLVGAT
jgi:chaperonin GroEL (HSP60 family)